MMSAVLVLLASALAAPSVDRDFAMRVQQHYPTWAVRGNQQTSSLVEIAVLPDGSVADCRILESSGNAQLAAEACAGTVGLKLRPAIDIDGNPTFGLIRTVITMTLSGAGRMPPLAIEPDVELTVDRLPAGADDLDVLVTLLVSPDGSVAQCEGKPPSEGGPPDAAYFEAACGQAMQMRGRVINDASGTSVQYVTNLRFRFTRDAAEPAA